jgi:translation initiation factor IF-2
MLWKHHGKIKAMHDEREYCYCCGSFDSVSVLGLDGATAGVISSIFWRWKEANKLLKRSQLMREQSVRTQRHITLDEIG